jgi:hypothetical protein
MCRRHPLSRTFQTARPLTRRGTSREVVIDGVTVNRATERPLQESEYAFKGGACQNEYRNFPLGSWRSAVADWVFQGHIGVFSDYVQSTTMFLTAFMAAYFVVFVLGLAFGFALAAFEAAEK